MSFLDHLEALRWHVVRAVADSGRRDIALYTGNDDNIVADLLTPFCFGGKNRRIVGGLLGHWSVWTKRAVELLDRCREASASPELMRLGVEITDCNAAFFDAANGIGQGRCSIRSESLLIIGEHGSAQCCQNQSRHRRVIPGDRQ